MKDCTYDTFPHREKVNLVCGIHGVKDSQPNDLSPLWVKEALKQEKQKLEKLEKAFDSLSNHETHYAQGIYLMIKARRKIVKIWESV